MQQQFLRIAENGKFVAALATFILITACNKHVAATHPPPLPPAVTPAKSVPPQAGAAAATPVAANERPARPDAATTARIQDLLDRLQDAYFDYDKHNIRPDAEAALESDAKTLAQILRQFPTYKLTVEGFCDERGSEEYNLALGDQRAKKTEEFLVTLGLPESQLRVVSYGKERPVCTEQTESCWQKNRRAHITQEQPS